MIPARSPLIRLLPWAEFAGFFVASTVLIACEIARHPEYFSAPSSLAGYMPDLESTWLGLAALMGNWSESQIRLMLWAAWPTWPGIALIAALPMWWLGVRGIATSSPARPVAQYQAAPRRASTPALMWILSLGLLALHVLITTLVARQFRNMPPAYHDEYSYIFQAKTFLAGRLHFDEQSPLFSQMHVLNDNGVFASRYFPGVGLWLAPWIAVGRAYWGQYLAGGLVVMLVSWIGYELPRLGCTQQESGPDTDRSGSIATGVAAGFFCTLSPALLLFGNLLLSHQPTMLGLAGFVLCYLRAVRSDSIAWPLIGGIALCLAMLCRPLTAFGFALPFAVHLASLVWRGKLSRCVPRVVAALGPIALGVAALAAYNAKLTGNPIKSPYGLYTQIYTPNHIYGFYNVTRGQEHAGPKVIENYNRWAEDLTPRRALLLFAQRADATAAWSLGRLSIAWLIGGFLVIVWQLPIEWKLLAAGVIGLYAVYFPYGFEGIFGLSYVIESVPALYLLAAGTSVWLLQTWREHGRWGRVIWLATFLCFNLNDPALRLVRGIAEIRFSRQYYSSFDRRLDDSGIQRPALVFIRPDPDDRHRDLVTNSPSLDDPILRARAGDLAQMEDLTKLYPIREFWLYDAKFNVLLPLEFGTGPVP